jgi:hypothetical protein
MLSSVIARSAQRDEAISGVLERVSLRREIVSLRSQ